MFTSLGCGQRTPAAGTQPAGPHSPQEGLVMQIVPKEGRQMHQRGSLLRPQALLAVQPGARLWTSLGLRFLIHRRPDDIDWGWTCKLSPGQISLIHAIWPGPGQACGGLLGKERIKAGCQTCSNPPLVTASNFGLKHFKFFCLTTSPFWSGENGAGVRCGCRS